MIDKVKDFLVNLFEVGILRNQWLWAHILLGAVLFKLLLLNMPVWASFSMVMIVATGYEMFQWIDGENELYDAIGDILGAATICLLLII